MNKEQADKQASESPVSSCDNCPLLNRTYDESSCNHPNAPRCGEPCYFCRVSGP